MEHRGAKKNKRMRAKKIARKNKSQIYSAAWRVRSKIVYKLEGRQQTSADTP